MTRLLCSFVAGFGHPARPCARPGGHGHRHHHLFANQPETALDRTGATVDVVTADDLATNPTTRVTDFLATLPGVAVDTNGGLGGVTTLHLRGQSGAYVPVLINGIDVTDPSGVQTHYDWGSLTLDTIGRIEVIKRLQSAIYRSKAIGGVISITTARIPDEPDEPD